MKNKGCQLNISMVKLWSDYVFYMKSFIVSSTDKLPDIQFIEERLERNCSDIGHLFGLVYGEYNGNRFSELLKEHLLLAADFIDSTVKGKIEDSVSHSLKWHMGIIKIVDFLSAIENFDRSNLRELFFDNLHLTEEYLMTRINKDYSNGIKTYDNLYDQTLLIADTLSNMMIYRIKD